MREEVFVVEFPHRKIALGRRGEEKVDLHFHDADDEKSERFLKREQQLKNFFTQLKRILFLKICYQ